MLPWGGAYQWRVRNFKIWEIRGKFQRSLKAVMIKLCLGTIFEDYQTISSQNVYCCDENCPMIYWNSLKLNWTYFKFYNEMGEWGKGCNLVFSSPIQDIIYGLYFSTGSIMVTFNIGGNEENVTSTISSLCIAIQNGTDFTFIGHSLTLSGYMTVDGSKYYGVSCGIVWLFYFCWTILSIALKCLITVELGTHDFMSPQMFNK